MWENRPLLVAYDLQDEEAFLKRKVKAVINLVNVDRVYSAPCPPDERPKTNAHIIGDRVMHVVLKNGQTYVFGEDSWTETVTTALKRCVANNPSPSLSPRMSDPKGLKKLSSGRLSILAASSPKVERKPTVTGRLFASTRMANNAFHRKTLPMLALRSASNQVRLNERARSCAASNELSRLPQVTCTSGNTTTRRSGSIATWC